MRVGVYGRPLHLRRGPLGLQPQASPNKPTFPPNYLDRRIRPRSVRGEKRGWNSRGWKSKRRSPKKKKTNKEEVPPADKVMKREPGLYLADLPEFDVQAGPWPFKKGETGNNKLIQVGGFFSPRGLGMHPPRDGKFASVKYRLDKKSYLFKATVAVNDTTNFCWSPATSGCWATARNCGNPGSSPPTTPASRIARSTSTGWRFWTCASRWRTATMAFTRSGWSRAWCRKKTRW